MRHLILIITICCGIVVNAQGKTINSSELDSSSAQNAEKELNNEGAKYPIFRGCQKKSTNTALEECSKLKIMNFIKMSFDTEMASLVLPLEKSTQFLLEFTINKKGKVETVNAKANHKAIAIEAIKIAKRLPKFKAPGTRNGKPVDTPFKLLMTVYF